MTYFPDRQFQDTGAYADAYFAKMASAAASIDRAALAMAGKLLEERSRAGSLVLSCGNGGSASIANHLACDCLKGVRNMSSLKPKVASLSANVELLTAIANDIGTDRLFSFQLESLGSQGDVLVAISSSGESPNIISALETARSQGLHSISLTGFAGGGARTLADVNVHVDCDNYGIVEDLHQSLMHILAQYLRHRNLDKPESLGSLKF